MTELHERDRLTSLGLYVVGGAAAVMSFTALADLAWLLGVDTEIPTPWSGGPTVRVAWLLPLAVDVFAFTASRIWLQGRTNADALRVAQRSAWAAIGTTVVGNGAHGYLVSGATGQPWWWSVIVSAVPALALGGLVHLAHLVGRGPDVTADRPVGADPGGDAWWALLDRFGGEPWDRAVAEWSARPGPESERLPEPPPRGSDNGALVADLRSVDRLLGRPLSRDRVVERYRVGGPRARALRELADQPTVPDRAPAELAEATR